jgi:hypothetical protein
MIIGCYKVVIESPIESQEIYSKDTGKIVILLHCPVWYFFPLYSKGSKGDPEAKMHRPSVLVNAYTI